MNDKGPMERAGEEYDPQLAKLPHPYRLMAVLGRMAERSGYRLAEDDFHVIPLGRATYGALIDLLAKEPINEIVIQTMMQHPTFATLCHNAVGTQASTHAGNLYWLLDYLRWRSQGRHLFQTTDALDVALQNSDVGEGIPVSLVRSPYPIVYLQFGETPLSSPYGINNPQSGRHVLEGAYVLSGTVSHGYRESGKRFIEFVFTGSSYGKANSLDDATSTITLAIPDEDATMLEVLEFALSRDEVRGRKHAEFEASDIRNALFHACKTILYLNSDKVTRTPVNERAELLARLAAVKSGHKAAKLARHLPRTMDRIVIGPRVAPAPAATPGSAGQGKRQHWRRGHFRDQRVGEGRAQIRVTWIAPILVHAEIGPAPIGKPYTIRGPEA